MRLTPAKDISSVRVGISGNLAFSMRDLLSGTFPVFRSSFPSGVVLPAPLDGLLYRGIP